MIEAIRGRTLRMRTWDGVFYALLLDELKDKTAVDAVDEYMIMTHIRHELPPDYDLCGK